MRLNFKKISAIVTSALMVGMTAGVAAAASYPAPFVEDGVGNVAIVYGSDAATTDRTAATNINEDLGDSVTGGSVTIEGDSIQLKRSTDEFNLGDNVTDFYSTLNNDELSLVLASKEYLNDQNDNFEYDQKLSLASNMQMTHFRDREYESYTPTVGIQLAKDDLILNYTLDFTPNAAEGGDASFSEMENTFIEILGKEYYISSVDVSGDDTDITLLDSANSAVLNEGESTTMNVGGDSYDVGLTFIGDNTVKFNVDGTPTTALSAGDTYKLADDSYIAVQEILVQDYAGGTKQVEFSIGSGKIKLVDGDEVEINNEAISQIDEYDGYKLNAVITNSSTDIEEIRLDWLADDDMFLTSESDLVMPGFESVKFTMGEFTSPSKEKTTFGTGDPISVTTDVEDGEVSIDLFYLNGDEDAFAAGNLGADSAQHLITNSTGDGTSSIVDLNLENETYFVASWISSRDAESYVYELSNIKDNSGKNETTLTNLADGSTVVFSDVDDNEDVGRLRLTLTAANEEGENATVKVEPVSGGSVYTDRVYTAEGLQFKLPWINSTNVDLYTGDETTQYTATTACDELHTLEDGEIYMGNVQYNSSVDDTATNTTCGLTSWDMNFTEEDIDGNIASGSSFQITLSVDSDDGIEADDLSGATAQQIGRTGDDYVAYVESDLATRIDWAKDTSGLDEMQIIYAGSGSSVPVYIAEASATTDGSTNVGGKVVMDTETSAYKDKNVIVVGGSCINSAAASLVGGAYCTEEWTSATEIGAGQFLIKGYADSTITSKHAMLVAGYAAADTTAAVNYLMNNEVDTSKTYEGTTTTATAVEVTTD